MSTARRASTEIAVGTALSATAVFFALESLALLASGSATVPSTADSVLWFLAVVTGVLLFTDGAATLVAERVRVG
ncbi:hypothetical protein [Halopelagius longus]|uniref:Uncharacterized protein n=1 Tax=Halopelagius longus TaxID=1236180 RepID=A0A1H1DS26_9EURY|nr:hypothetical protein [Halopelagius longus]RDI71449.1 hypothetical protein DWB78_06780 [Halopelagius longus]SDQ79341.1 hypothetical protein SAMN05216278_2556 [Halopelagius longus]